MIVWYSFWYKNKNPFLLRIIKSNEVVHFLICRKIRGNLSLYTPIVRRLTGDLIMIKWNIYANRYQVCPLPLRTWSCVMWRPKLTGGPTLLTTTASESAEVLRWGIFFMLGFKWWKPTWCRYLVFETCESEILDSCDLLFVNFCWDDSSSFGWCIIGLTPVYVVYVG